MKCKIEGCGGEVKYKAHQACSKHYARFLRTGSYELTRARRYRISNPAGYQKLHEPRHPLANSDGHVYEHRFVYHTQISDKVSECAICGTAITWKTCHIDHIDEDVTNNKKENLRALCRGCNVFRGHDPCSMGKSFFTVGDVTMTASAWARSDAVEVSPNTILRRRSLGMNDHDAIFKARGTHHNTKTKKVERKNDDMRGIKDHTAKAKELEGL